MSPSSGRRRPLALADGRSFARIGTAGWVGAVVSGLAFVMFAYDVAARRPLPFDAPVLVWLHQHATSGLTAVARGLSAVGEPTVVGPLTLLIVLALLAVRSWRRAVLMASEVGGAAALDVVLKPLFARPRPTLYPHLVHETNFSFPSGHAVGDLAFALALCLVVANLDRSRWRWVAGLLVALALLIGASRPYLQVHYPSDVLAGWALGLAWVLASHGVLARWLRRPARHTRQRSWRSPPGPP